jgi:ATP-binding cassette subfamily C protein
MTVAGGERWTDDLRRFLREFAAYAGRRGIAAGVLVALGAVLEGLGLVLIVPLLGIVIGSPQAGGRLGILTLAVFQRLGVDRPFGQLALLLGLFSALMVVRAVVLSLRDVAAAQLQAGFVEARRARIVERLAAARWDLLAQLRHARVTHIMSGDMARIGGMANHALQCAIAMALLFAQGILIFLLAPILASLILVLLIVGAIVLVPGVQRTHGLGGTMTNANLSLLGLTAHFLGGLKIAMSQNLQAAFVAEVRQSLHEQTQLQVDAARHQTRRRLALTTVSALSAAALVLVGFGLFDIAPPVLIALLLIVTRMVGPIGQVQQSVQQIALALPAFRTVTELERDLSALPGEPPVAPTGALLAEGPIVFHDVSFQHAAVESDAPARGIAHIALAIRPGELIGVAGPSGAGKTTFADLLVGLFPPQQGRIDVGGMSLDGAALAAWRDRIGYVSQDPFLFHDTVRRNLAWAQPKASDAELWQALTIAGAEAMVRAMPHGLDTLVGERGTLLSGGERQRIALARAVLRKPHLLVLDEATGALDAASEREIVARLRAIQPRPAIVIIAHRAESIALCDRVLRFEAGRCVDDTAAGSAGPRIVAQQ